MTYRLQVDESVPDGLRRVIDEQISSAAENLSKGNEDVEEGIHEARKCFKKIRAVLRLGRDELGNDYSRENQWFRDAGRSLSGYRDITATLEALGKLRETMKEEVDAAVFDDAANTLQKNRSEITENNGQLVEQMKSLVDALKEKQQEIEKLPLYTDDFNALRDGLQRTYKRGRKAMHQAYQEISAENFHEWRKRVKYHWYHCRLLTEVWPGVMNKYTHQVHQLANVLGDYHDLDILRSRVTEEIAPETTCDMGNLLRLIDGRQAAFRKEALPLGHRLYAEKSKDFVTRMEHYWNAWRTPDKLKLD